MCEGERNSQLQSAYCDYIICPKCGSPMSYVNRFPLNKTTKVVCTQSDCSINGKHYLVSGHKINLLAIGE
jgi:hypothetical protein